MGIAQAGTAISDGENLAIQGVKPKGMAAQGHVIWSSYVWQLLNYVSSGGVSMPTTPPMDTTGAVLLVTATSEYSGPGTMTDSQNNVWIKGVEAGTSTAVPSRIFYSINPATSSAHTFDYSGGYSSMVVMAFHGPASLAVDQSSGNFIAGGGTSIQASPITPSAVPSLVISGLATSDYGGTIDSPFVFVASVPRGSGGFEAVSAAYLIQTSAGSLAPTWTLATLDGYLATTLLSFKPS